VATKAEQEKKKNGGKPTAEEGAAKAIVLTRIRRELIEVEIQGITPVIPHKWSEKAKRQMLDKQQNKTTQRKEAKDPAAEAEAATYWLPEGVPGIPATAFKAAIADAARYFDNVTITMLKQAVFVLGEGPEQLVPLAGEITMREDTPRNASGVADLRYRNQVWPWSALLRIDYIPSMLTAESVVALADAAGNGGVGDWRPSAPKSKTGTFGRWQVIT